MAVEDLQEEAEVALVVAATIVVDILLEEAATVVDTEAEAEGMLPTKPSIGHMLE